MWLGTLSLLGNLLAGEEVVAVGVGVIRESERLAQYRTFNAASSFN